jgi:hypothetical protein
VRTISNLIAAVVLNLALFASVVEATPILVSADATVAGGAVADVNFGSEEFAGGLLSGMDGSRIFGPYRFYLLFALPAFAPGTQITSATLRGWYNADWDTFDDRTHSLYQAPTTWSESTITWNNQPGPSSGVLGVFNASSSLPGTLQFWNLTTAVNGAYLAHDAFFSLMFRADDEGVGVVPFNNNLEYFASREYLGGTRGFILDVQVTGADSSSVPEPTTLLLVGAGLAGVVAYRRNRSMTS